MVLLQNNGAGGTVGVTATAANSGGASGTAFSSKYFGAQNNTIIFASLASLGTCYRFQQPSASAGSGGWTWSGFSSTDFGFRFSMDLNGGAYPANGTRLVGAFSTYSSGFAGGIGVSGTGKPTLTNAAGTTVWTATAAIPTTGRFDLAIEIVPGSTTSNGTLRIGYWTSNFGGAPTETFTAVGTANAGTAAVTYVEFPKSTSTVWQMDAYATNFYADTAAAGALPPVWTTPANQPPTLAALPVVVGTAGTGTTFTPTASDPEGGALTYQWAVAAFDGAPFTNTSLTGATLTVTPGNHSAGARYDVSLVVTDAQGATASSQSGRLLVRGDNIVPIVELASGGWTAQGLTDTPANRVVALRDSVTGTTLRAPTPTATPADFWARLAPLRSAAKDWGLLVPSHLTDGASLQFTISVREGNTIRATWRLGALSASADVTGGVEQGGAPTTAYKTPRLTAANVTTGSLANITNWDELDIGLSSVAA